RADIGPVEQGFRVGVAHADAAVAAGDAEAGAPVGAVNGVVAPERHDPVDIGDVVVRSVWIDATEAHLSRLHLYVVAAGGGGRGGHTGGDVDGADRLVILVQGHGLAAQADVHPLVVRRGEAG